MIVPDINLLLYAEIDAHPLHRPALRWWEAALNGSRSIGLAPVSLFGFIRISTNRRVFTDPLPIADAIERTQSWLERPHVVFVAAGSRHLGLAFDLLRALGTGGNLTTDVQIAAHALEHNAEVYSNDQDFGRFEGLRWVNPVRI